MATYKILPKKRYSKDLYAVTSFRRQDILLVKKWRNEQMDVLRQKRILTDEDQEHYYNGFVRPSFEQELPRIMLFSFLYDEECIGYGGLTNIDWEDKRFELSFLVSTQRVKNKERYAEDFSAFLSLMKHVGFNVLGLNRIFTETFDIRAHHIKILEDNGFRMEGRLKQHVMIHGIPTDSLMHGFLKEYGNADNSIQGINEG